MATLFQKLVGEKMGLGFDKRYCIVCEKTNVVKTWHFPPTLHDFPKDPILKQKWLESLQLTQHKISCRARVCEHHFRKSDRSLCRIKKTAVPLLTLPARKNVYLSQNQNSQQALVTIAPAALTASILSTTTGTLSSAIITKGPPTFPSLMLTKAPAPRVQGPGPVFLIQEQPT